MPGSFECCRKVIEGQRAPYARQVAGREFFYCRRTVGLDHPQGLACLAVGVGSVAEGFDARRGHPMDFLARRP